MKYIITLLALLIVLLSSITYNILSIKQYPSSIFSDDVASPHDRIKMNQILLFDDKVVVNIKDATLASYADTNSMDPLIDKEANGIEIKPKDIKDIHIGDVVAYQYKDELIVHRVIHIGNDEEGWYALMKGDNNNYVDEEKIRFNQIEYILVGVLY